MVRDGPRRGGDSRLIGEAFAALTRGRPRPAALFLPQDLMRRPADWHDPRPAAVADSRLMPAAAIAEAAALLARAERPIILAGGGALWGNAAAELADLAARLGAPVVTSVNAKGLIDERDPRSLGHARSARARAALPHADAMLAVGCRFTEILTEGWRMPVPANLVQIDVDPEQIGMNYPVGPRHRGRCPVRAGGTARRARGTASTAMQRRLGHARGQARARPADATGMVDRHATGRAPRGDSALLRRLRDGLPAPDRLDRLTARDASSIPSNYITLGWGFPAALGAAFALGDRPVVSVSGDGGFLMTAQELATAVRYRRRVIALVHNDSTYGAIKNIQRRVHDGRYLDVDLNNPDFPRWPPLMGCPGSVPATPWNCDRPSARALDRDGPSLIEVPDRWRMLRV